MSSPPSHSPQPIVSVIVPARNEEANLGACLESLIAQTNVGFEIIVVDDGSTDRTREIAQSCDGVRVISPGVLPAGWTGKNNAVVAGEKASSGDWMLFTDADTVHRVGSLARALDEARREQADLLSYSPEQTVETFAERAVMPVIFSELAAEYPLRKISEQATDKVAANGQYILVKRAAYDAVGGHAAVATTILEDVALAQRFQDAGHRVFFRYGGHAVSTRMYRSWPQLREGWTKNLALLFSNPERLASQTVSWWLAAWASVGILIFGAITGHYAICLFAAFWFLLFWRISKAHFSLFNNLIAIAFGPPMFAYLLLRSKHAHRSGQVSWKGREYGVGAASGNVPDKGDVLTHKSQELTAKS